MLLSLDHKVLGLNFARDGVHDCMTVHYTELSIIIPSSSQYDLLLKET